MKKVLIYLLVLIVFGCSTESPLTETVDVTLHTPVSLNENSTLIVTNSVINDPVYGTLVTLRITPSQFKIKKVTINNFSFLVEKYECTPEEIMGVLTFNKGSADAYIMIHPLKSNYSSSFSTDFEFKQKMENDLLKQGSTIFDFHSTIPVSNTSFDIRLSFTSDITIEYVKD
jgi:hypothetical protein